MRRPMVVLASVTIAAGLVLGACDSGSESRPERWSDLRSVSVTVVQPGVPPPGNTPRTTTFRSADEVDRVTALLNRYDIRKGTARSREGCTGGREVTIEITRRQGSTVTIDAYLCAGRQFGEARGDVDGFVDALDAVSAAAA